MGASSTLWRRRAWRILVVGLLLALLVGFTYEQRGRRQDSQHPQKASREIHAEYTVPTFSVGSVDRFVARYDTSVVDKHVDTSVFCNDVLDHASPVFIQRHIELHMLDSVSLCSWFNVASDYRCAFSSECLRHGEANPLCCTRNEGDFSFKSVHLVLRIRSLGCLH